MEWKKNKGIGGNRREREKMAWNRSS